MRKIVLKTMKYTFFAAATVATALTVDTYINSELIMSAGYFNAAISLALTAYYFESREEM